METYNRGPLLNPNIEVHWLGWSTDLARLQANGWKIRSHQDHDFYRNAYTYQFSFRHEGLELVAYAEYGMMGPGVINVQRVCPLSQLNVVLPPEMVHGEGVDLPTIANRPMNIPAGEREVEYMKSTGSFAYDDSLPPWDVRNVFGFEEAASVFIEQADMSITEHLQAIKDKQQEAQSEIRKRMLTDAALEKRRVQTLKLVQAA